MAHDWDTYVFHASCASYEHDILVGDLDKPGRLENVDMVSAGLVNQIAQSIRY